MASQKSGNKRERFGVIARYKDVDGLLGAARKVKEAGYADLEAYSPFPVDGLAEILGQKETRLPWIIFWGGFFGALLGFMMCYAANVLMYPLNIGGRPFNSWPAFIPIAFELTILCAVLSGFFALIIRCGMPKLHDPVFSTNNFERASIDAFFLCIMAKDKKFEPAETRRVLQGTGPEEITDL